MTTPMRILLLVLQAVAVAVGIWLGVMAYNAWA
jgi:hypothetical protein